VEPQALLWLAALALVASSAIMAAAQRRFPPALAGPVQDADVTSEQASEAPRPVWSSSYVRALIAVGMAAAVVGVLVEFRFYLAAAASGGEGRDQAEFFATFYLTLNLGALVIQLWVLPRILHRVGLGGALLILPVALVGGAAALAASVSLAVAAAVRVTEGGLKSSIHRTSWEQAYLPLAVADRPRTRVFVDGLATRVAEGMAGGLLLLWLHVIVADAGVTEGATRWITALMVLAVAAWLAATEWLGRELRRSGRRRPGPGVYLPLRLPDG
jgi:AAA family ATP:ADP antiporter